MRIAIHASDLDHKRIDGTRVYIKNVLESLGSLAPQDQFLIYHKGEFNPVLAPQKLVNYIFKKIPFPLLWTQTRFAWQVWRDKPEALWLPIHNLPLVRHKEMRSVVTIHDLAFKIFPQYFTGKDLRKLNLLADYAIIHATSLIAVSESTKQDILNFYPKVDKEKITVVQHGFEAGLFAQEISEDRRKTLLAKYGIESKQYFLYVGAIQPRKNLEVLMEAFEKVKEAGSNFKLVLAGEKAWMWEGVLEKIEKSVFRDDIIVIGAVAFEELPILYQNSFAFIFPSLYEGFGIPLLEAFASGVPVICANNSSLPEVGGEGALYFNAASSEELAKKIQNLLDDSDLQERLIEKGRAQLQKFSWEKCARETLEVIRSSGSNRPLDESAF